MDLCSAIAPLPKSERPHSSYCFLAPVKTPLKFSKVNHRRWVSTIKNERRQLIGAGC